jgi:antitoxin ParD1/3/4
MVQSMADRFIADHGRCRSGGSIRPFYLLWRLLISIAIAGKMQPTVDLFTECPSLSSSLNVQLTDALRKYVDERASDKDVYATPSEYIRDLIRQDMQDRAIALNVLEGLDDLKHGRFSSKSIRDLKNED